MLSNSNEALNKSKHNEEDLSLSISNGINYLMNKATTLYKSYDQKENKENKENTENTETNDMENLKPLKSTNIHSNWFWDHHASWIPFDPATSKEIDLNITSYLNNSIASADNNNNDNTLTFLLSKGKYFTKPQNKNIYFCQIEFKENTLNSRQIKAAYQLNKNTNFKRELKREPPFNLNIKSIHSLSMSSILMNSCYDYIKNIDIDVNDYIPYRTQLKLNPLLENTKDLNIPFWWNINKKSHCVIGENVFELSLKRNICKEITLKFMEGLAFDNDNNDEFEIKSIYCVENKSLYRLYQAVKMIMKDYLDENKLNERYLWHGTNINAAKSIVFTGFNRDYGETMMYGKGVYFAKYSGYSSDKRYSKPDDNKYQYMFLCRVLLGESCCGNEKYKVPPCKSLNSYHNFESMVNNLSNPTIFVISKDNQVYPEFLLKFKKIPKCLFVGKFE